MSRFDPDKLHVRFMKPCTPTGPMMPRRYTLTHSDLTGNLFLTVGPHHDMGRLSGIYSRLMRDEVMGEWIHNLDDHTLRIRVHVSGGLVLGTARMRFSIFKREMPLALSAIVHGDREFYEEHPNLMGSHIMVHFVSGDPRFNVLKDYGMTYDYIRK